MRCANHLVKLFQQTLFKRQTIFELNVNGHEPFRDFPTLYAGRIFKRRICCVLLHSYYQTRIIFQQADTMDDGVNFHYEWIQTLVAEWHE